LIKTFYFYKKDFRDFIYNIFEGVDIEFSDISIENILKDFNNILIKNKIYDKVFLDGSFEWQEESNLIDLQFYIEEKFENCWGSFYVTWFKDTWECKNIWYSGDTEDGEQVFKDWANK